MSAPATQDAPHDDPGPQGAGTRGSGQVLHYIINVGAEFVRLLHEQALAHATQQAAALAQQAAASAQHTAVPAPQATHTPPAANTPQAADAQPAPAPPPPAPVLALNPDALIRTAASFDQIARAVRRCIALAHHLDTPKHQPARHPAQPPAPDRTAARKRILRAVEDNIQRPPDNPECDDAEILLSDFRERMDTPDLDADIASRPVADIIQDILRDLGLAALPGSRPWKRRTPADIAELNARAAAPTSPARGADRPPGPGPAGRPSRPHPPSRRSPARRSRRSPSPPPVPPPSANPARPNQAIPPPPPGPPSAPATPSPKTRPKP